MNVDVGNRVIVLKALVGSHNYNLNTSESDRDFKFFVTPSFDDLYGGTMFSYGKESPDIDVTVHDIRKFGDLIWRANINFVEILFSKELSFHAELGWIFDNADDLAKINLPSMCGALFGMHNQKMANLSKGTATTKKLVEKFGFDTKEATHALRCLFLLDRISFGVPVREALWFESGSLERDFLLALKRGEVGLPDVHSMVADFNRNIKDRARTWFMSQPVNHGLKADLDAFIKETVRERV